jgi:hypothetical protein
MNDRAEASPPTPCKATTKAGNPCRKPAVERGFCLFHSGKLNLSEQGRRGGKASGEARSRKQQPEQAGDRLERIAHAAIEELLQGSGSATARASAARLVLDKIASSSPYSAELARRAASDEIRAQMEAELPAARKLVRLIETRAQAKANAMTEAKLKPLVEPRARAMAEQMYAERMRLETEAVKAELADSTEPLPDPTPDLVEEDRARQFEEERARQEAERIARDLDLPPES